jgi:HSP20 family protein
VLNVLGERKQEKEEKGRRYHRLERSYGSFVRSFTVPDAVDEAKVTAEFKDGMLNLRLPKSEKARPKSVDVKIG